MLKNYEKKCKKIRESIINIGSGLITANQMILDSMQNCDREKFNDAKSHIKNVPQKTVDIDNSIITTLALHAPEAKDLRTMVSYLKITNDLLRASSNTKTFIKGFQDVCSDVDIKTINSYAIPMQKATVEALTYAVEMFELENVDEVKTAFDKVVVAENKTDELYEMIESELLKEAKNNEDFTKYHMMLATLRKSEKIADRALSIASLLEFAKIGGDINTL
ncbi:PhoU family transcriptional regulator [Sulfurimonas sp.]|nr:PhoU family transcriptional regulator [Sulfurimonas sp.]